MRQNITGYETDEEGRIVKVKSEGAAISVTWNSSKSELIHYANFIISEVCSNRGIENPKGSD